MINQQTQQLQDPVTEMVDTLEPSVVVEPVSQAATEDVIQEANVQIDAQTALLTPDERTQYPDQLGLLLAYANDPATMTDSLPMYSAQLRSGDNKPVIANVAQKIKEENLEVDREAARIAASKGNVKVLEQLAFDLQQTTDLSKETTQNVLKNLNLVADKAVGSAYANTGRAVDDKAVVAVDAATEMLSVSQLLAIKHKELDTKLGESGVEKWANVVGSVSGMLGQSLIPLADAAQRYALIRRVRGALGYPELSDSAIAGFDLANLVEEVRNELNTPSGTRKQEVFNKITSALEADPFIKTNPLIYKAFLYDFFENTGAETRFFDNVNVALLPLDVFVIGGVMRAVMNGGKIAKTMANVGDVKTVTDITENVLKNTGNMPSVNTQTAFGISGADAISSANSLKATNVVGPLVSSVKPDLQSKLINDAAKVYQDITTALHSSGKTEDELKAAAEQARAKYDPSVNPNIVSSEVTNVGSRGADVTVMWKAGENLEEAQARLETMRKQGRNVELVESKPTPDALLTPKEIQSLNNQREALVREIDLRKSRLSRGELFESDVAVKGNDNLEFAYQEADMMFGGDIKVGHILDTIESTSDNAANKALASWLKNNSGGMKNVAIKRLETDADWANFYKAERGVDISKADDLSRQEFNAIKADLKGAYVYSNDTLYIRGSHIKDEGLALHEIAHAQMSQLIDSVLKPGVRGALDIYNVPYKATAKQERAVRNLQAIYEDTFNQFKKSLNPADAVEGRGFVLRPDDVEYGFKDVHEMLSEALSNESFRNVLKNMKLSKETQAMLGSTVKNMWEAFTKLFSEILGIPAKQGNALSALLDEYAKASKGITKQQRTSMTQAGEYLGDVRFKKEAKSNEAYLKSAYRRLAQIEEKLAYSKAEESAIGKGYTIREYRTETTSLDKIGLFAEADVQGAYPFKFFNKVIDPHHATSEFAVQQRVLGVFEQAGVQNALVDYVKPAWQKLSNRQAQKVEDVLKEGDSYSDAAGGVGRDFSAVELKDRFMSVAKNDADMDKMMEAYYRVRGTRNIMWDIRNGEMAKSLTAQGFKQVYVKIGTSDEFVTAGKIVRNVDLEGKTVFNSLEGKPVRLTPEKITEMNNAGQYVVELREMYKSAEGKNYSRMLVSGDNTKVSDIYSVLGKRPGEYARIYDDEYFIQAKRKMTIDDEEVAKDMHFATARTKREAQEYVNGFNDLLKERKANPAGITREKVVEKIGKYEDSDRFFADLTAGKYDDYDNISFHYDRMPDEYINDYIGANADTGRLFVDKRGEKLKAIGGENRDNTLSVLDSVQREILNTARVASINEWKDSLIQRWYNQVKEFLPEDMAGKDPKAAFFGMSSREYVGTEDTQAFARSVQEYVMQQVGAVTGEEKVQRATARAFTEWAEKVAFNGKAPEGFGKGIEWVGQKLRNAKPIEFLRTITFHTTLGMFNPAQLVVQSAGATTAMVLHPFHGAKAALSVPLYRIAMMSDNPQVWKTLIKGQNLVELGLKNEAEFIETVQALKKSNILSGIRSTSLYNMEDGTYNVFNKGIIGAKATVAEASPFFFNRGEEFARMVAFDVARRLAKETDAAVNIMDDAVLTKIIGQADDFTQNMTNANRAAYQSGLLSIPLQFMQYNIKLSVNVATAYMSAITGKPVRGFNATQATKMLAGNAVLYGLAGAGLTEAVDYFFPDNDTWSSEQRLYVSEGMVAGFINSLSLALSDKKLELGLGTRLSPFNFFKEWSNALQDKSFLEVAAGPSLSVWQRADRVGNILSVLVNDSNLTAKEVLTGLQYAGFELTGSLSNAAKAYVLKNNDYKLMSRTGKNLARVSEMEMWAQAMGIAPAQVADINRIYESKRNHTKELDEITDKIVTLQTLALKAYNTGDVDSFQKYNLAAKVFWPNNGDDLRYVYGKVNQLQGKGFLTEFEKAIYKVYQRPGQENRPFITTPTLPEASKGR